MGHAAQSIRARADLHDNQKVVCFTETPLEHINLLTEEIEGREVSFEPYGIALTKRTARRLGVNPVWYLDITPGHGWLTEPINRMIDAEMAANTFATSDVARLTPFIEQMGTMAGRYRKEFWWEREWRHVGHFTLAPHQIGIAPAADHVLFDAASAAAQRSIVWIDATWGLEQIIGHLAGFPSDDIGV